MLKFHPYSILTVETMVGFVIFCVLKPSSTKIRTFTLAFIWSLMCHLSFLCQKNNLLRKQIFGFWSFFYVNYFSNVLLLFMSIFLFQVSWQKINSIYYTLPNNYFKCFSINLVRWAPKYSWKRFFPLPKLRCCHN